ncbi:MAG: TIGR03618 family F420-dependent PPOX class oxidoreductase [Gaiellaceae bacterium]
MLQLSESARRKLAAPNFVFLATVRDDGSPHVVPVWADLEDGRIVLATESGSLKERNLRRDARVGLSVADRRTPYDKLDVRGRVVGMRAGEEAVRLMHSLAHKYTGRDYPYDMSRLVKVTIEPERIYEEDFPDLREAEVDTAAQVLSGEARELAAEVLATAGRDQLDALADLLAAARDDALVQRAREQLRA